MYVLITSKAVVPPCSNQIDDNDYTVDCFTNDLLGIAKQIGVRATVYLSCASIKLRNVSS